MYVVAVAHIYIETRWRAHTHSHTKQHSDSNSRQTNGPVQGCDAWARPRVLTASCSHVWPCICCWPHIPRLPTADTQTHTHHTNTVVEKEYDSCLRARDAASGRFYHNESSMYAARWPGCCEYYKLAEDGWGGEGDAICFSRFWLDPLFWVFDLNFGMCENGCAADGRASKLIYTERQVFDAEYEVCVCVLMVWCTWFLLLEFLGWVIFQYTLLAGN